MQLSLAGLDGTLDFDPETEDVARGLAEVLQGWPMSQPEPDREATPLLRVTRSGEAVRVERLRRPWSALEPTPVSAVCTLVVEIVAAWVEQLAGIGCLHAAAAEFAGRLAVFPSTHRAGKSTLMAALAARGRRIFADDLLPVDLAARRAVATGCLPRLRLPLPDDAPDMLRRHVRARTALSDGYYCYAGALPGREVRHGERARLGAIVTLERRRRQAARLEPMPVEEALTALLMQNTNDRLAADSAIGAYLDLLEGLSAWRLTFSDLDEGADLLEEAFARWPEDRPTPWKAQRAPATAEPAATPARGHGGMLFRRACGVSLKPVGEAGFLAGPGGIHRLDGLGVGLWNLLAAPLGRDDIAAVFCGAFPDAPANQVRRDIGRLLDELLAEGLVVRVEPGA